MMVRIKARHAAEVRRRRSIVAGAFTALSVWLLAGLSLFGGSWLIGVLYGIGIALFAGFVLTLKTLIYINNLEAMSGAWEEREPLPLALSALTGNTMVCVVIFAVYQSSLDFGASREKTIAIAAATAVSFVVAYILAPKFGSMSA